MRLQLQHLTSVSVGRRENVDVIIKNKKVSGVHCNFFKKNDGWYVADLNSTNGTFVNDERILAPRLLKAGDCVKIATVTVDYDGNNLVFNGTDEIISNISERSLENTATDAIDTEVRNDGSINTGTEKKKKLPEPAPYPYFTRSPRLIESVPVGEIEIEAAPDTMAKPSTNWASIILSSLGMMAAMLLIGLISGGIGLGFLYFIPMSVISILTAVITYNSQKRKYKKEQELLKQKYEKYLEDKEKEIADAVKVQKEIAYRKDPELPICIAIASGRTPKLWTRNLTDYDAVSVRIGTGDIPFAKTIKVPKVGLTLYEKRYQNDPGNLYDKYEIIPDMPLAVNFHDTPTLGIVGDHDGVSELVRSMIIHASTHYSYDELKLVFVYAENERQNWDWVRWLPHVWDESRSNRFIACSQYTIKEVLKPIEDELKSRKPAENQAFNMMSEDNSSPFYLFILISPAMLNGMDITSLLLSNDPNLAAGCVILGNNVHILPRSTSAVIEVQGANSRYYPMNAVNNITLFKRDQADIATCEKFARNMAPVRCEGSAKEQSLPNYVTFMDGYNIRRPEELDLMEYWLNARPERTMSVPIGIRANGEKFYFDINEKAHGPHGLVAGTTGSGKSEMIQSWIVSMAIQFSPEDVSFVLIDFKGTGLILPFMNLPHLAGKISDLDTSIDRNLVALEAELQRRKALFDEAGVSNISSYLELYHTGRVKQPLSYLFVIIDEYAEFKANYPDFTAAIDALFRTGRTLGVHIILLMQNPGGVVTGQSESNVRFRWCLKVASKIASKEVIEHPDAAKITNPGRAYVRVGTDEVYELIQSFYSGGKYTPQHRKEKRNPEPEIARVDISGKRQNIADDGRKSIKYKKGTEIEALVNYIDDYVQRKHLNRAKPIWTEKMPDVIFLEKIISEYGDNKKAGELEPVVGLLDDPATQKQYPFRVSLSENGHAVIYGAPGTGKSTFLYTLIYSICHSYTPKEVNLYLMDFGSWNMGMFRDYPHVGAEVNDNEEEKVGNIISFLESVLDERKLSFSQMGVGSIQAYNYSAKEKIPYIVLIIDNFAPVLQLYPQYENFFSRLVKEGGSYGVLLVSTSNAAAGLGFKLQQNIRTNICLQMSDPSDYSSIVGRTGGLQPDNYPGRGLYKEDRVMEFQVALPGNSREDNTRSLAIREEGKKLAAKWKGILPRKLTIMPDVIDYGSVKADRGITIGIASAGMNPLGVDFNENHTLLISGTEQAGKSTILRNIIRQAKDEEPNAKIILYGKADDYADIRDEITEQYESGSDFDKCMPGISEILKERKAKLTENALGDVEPVYIIVDNFKSFYEQILDETADRLLALVQIGAGLKVYFIVADNAGVLGGLRGMIPLLDRLAQKAAIMLGGYDYDHLIIDTTVPDEFRGMKLGKYEGYFIFNDRFVKFKSMNSK